MPRLSRKSSLEAIMAEQSSMHFYLNWAKERIDRIDAALASLEVKAGQTQADWKVKANQLIAELEIERDEFQATVKKQVEASEAVWERTKAHVGTPVEQLRSASETLHRHCRQAISSSRRSYSATSPPLRRRRGAKWPDKFYDAATKFAAERRAEIEAAVKQMRANAEADARLRKLKQAGSASRGRR